MIREQLDLNEKPDTISMKRLDVKFHIRYALTWFSKTRREKTGRKLSPNDCLWVPEFGNRFPASFYFIFSPNFLN